ncbi:hypothetical protein [Achromobacter sp.]|jgi:hypothetical protein|uniref:hypothetical protein n=1 Tax=Achromobacter sp. TaxID=134375 RepID=UPI00258EAD63|nr:hypothetical protein [Achromobacter sp.]
MKYRLNDHIEEFIDNDAELTAHWVFTEEGKPLSRYNDNIEESDNNYYGKAVVLMGGFFLASVIFLVYAVAKHSFLI